jgi:hypothetical protein
VADARRTAVDAGLRPDRGFNHAQGLWRTRADRLFVILARPIAPGNAPFWRLPPSQGWAKGLGGDTTHAWDEAGRVVIIGCEHRLFVHTLSKNWAMTDRQIGWFQAHPSLGQKTEKMIPCIASGERSLWPPALALRERGEGPPSGARRGDHGLGRQHGRLRRRSVNRVLPHAPGGHWSMGGRVWAPVARGVHYNWKGPPIGIPLRASGSPPAQSRIQFRVH